LPQQHDVQRFRGGGEPGERLARVGIANQPAYGFLKRRVARERLKQITNCRVCHETREPASRLYFTVARFRLMLASLEQDLDHLLAVGAAPACSRGPTGRTRRTRSPVNVS
jgi:hypothetical protein